MTSVVPESNNCKILNDYTIMEVEKVDLCFWITFLLKIPQKPVTRYMVSNCIY
jgi:hypothetical protein